jgi:aspartate/methionine/tyrosine aminotransferase
MKYISLSFVLGVDLSFKPPEFLLQAAKDALDDVAANQYSHTLGRPRLRQALSKAYSPFFGRTIDPNTVLPILFWQLTEGNCCNSRC